MRYLCWRCIACRIAPTKHVLHGATRNALRRGNTTSDRWRRRFEKALTTMSPGPPDDAFSQAAKTTTLSVCVRLAQSHSSHHYQECPLCHLMTPASRPNSIGLGSPTICPLSTLHRSAYAAVSETQEGRVLSNASGMCRPILCSLMGTATQPDRCSGYRLVTYRLSAWPLPTTFLFWALVAQLLRVRIVCASWIGGCNICQY